MGLSNDKIREIAKDRPHQKEIQKGISHQERLKFHSETILNESDFGNAWWNFTAWVGRNTPELLPADKFARFLQLLQLPLPTTELTESIYSRLARVFFSQDNFFNYEFDSPELHQDWLSFRNEKFWSTKGFQAMQSAIDSVWVVDLPEEQLTSRPAPFNRLINISNVIDIENDEDNNCRYVIYRYSDKVVAYDDELIRVYDVEAIKTRGIVRGVDIRDPIKEIPHGLGYTPARQFWSKQLESNNFINKEAPITKELSDLDWLLFHMTCKKHMDISNSYPILVKYEDGGYENDDPTANKDRPEGNKRPLGNKMIGPGTYAEVPLPRTADEFDAMKNPVKLISPDVDTMKWHVTEEKRLKDTIFKSVVGTDTEVRNDAAKNESQIDAAFESQKSVLLNIKHNFETINTFADNTIARLRYGEAFTGCKIDYGSEFFLKSVKDLHEDRKLARESGASEAIVADISEKILNTEYKEDYVSRQHAEIIYELDPLPEKDLEETIKIFDKGGIDKINFIIKCNLLNFVRRFERENISLVEFAKDIDYAKKISLILETFKNYADESEQRPEDPNQGL